MHVFYERQGSTTATVYPGVSVPSSSSPYATCLVSISAVVQGIPEKEFVLVFFSPSADIDCSLTQISKGGHDYLPSANLSVLHYTDIRLPARSGKCSSLQQYSRENKISNLLSAINFQEDWSRGTQCESWNLTLGWTLAEYQVWGGETTRNEVTQNTWGIQSCGMDIQFTINSHDENRQGGGRKSPKIEIGHENNADFRTD